MRDRLHFLVNTTFNHQGVFLLPLFAVFALFPNDWPSDSPFWVQVLLAILVLDVGISAAVIQKSRVRANLCAGRSFLLSPSSPIVMTARILSAALSALLLMALTTRAPSRGARQGDLLRNCRVRSCWGFVKKWSGGASSMKWPWSMNITRSAT